MKKNKGKGLNQKVVNLQNEKLQILKTVETLQKQSQKNTQN